MKDEKPMEELVKIVIDFRVFMNNLADELAKALADIKAPVEEEDTWEMKCPYKDGDEYYFVSANGLAKYDSWDNYDFEKRALAQGNIFKTQQEAELESKRRNLLTRFRAFRDECNKGLSVQDEKWEINYKDKKLKSLWLPNSINGFPTFGYFKNREDADRAIELFGDEIKELFVDCEAQ